MKNASLPTMLAVLTWTALLGNAQESKPEQPAKSPEAPANATASPAADFIRYMEDQGSARLETVVRSFTSNSGAQVDLVGVVHIGDEAYYKKLNTLLAGYDSVLFELVGNPEDLKKSQKGEGGGDSKNPLRGIQKMVGNLLKLSFQLDHIEYSRPNFVHADLDAEGLSDAMKDRGENLMTLMAKAMKAQRETGDKMTESAEDLDMGEILSALMSGDGADSLKITLAKVFDKSEVMIEHMEKQGEGTAILTGRNEAALKKMEAEQNAGKKKLAIFYGAGHLPGMEADLKKKGYQVQKEDWLAAWQMKAPEKAKSKAAEKK